MSEYKYGMRLRGFAPLCQPKEGLVRREDSTCPRYHDIIVYNRPLTDTELVNYELDDLNLAPYKVRYVIELEIYATSEKEAREIADMYVAEGEFSEEWLSTERIYT